MLEGLYTGFDDYLAALLTGKANHWGAWSRHVSSWLHSPIASTDQMLLIRFEDLRQNPELLLSQITNFLGVNVDRTRIQAAVLNNSVEQMRAKESRARTSPTSGQVSWIGKGGLFVREGSVRGWRHKLNPDHVQLIDQFAASELARLGYPTGASANFASSKQQPA
jgi:hypothetical protein